jgi:hypothetical protein
VSGEVGRGVLRSSGVGKNEILSTKSEIRNKFKILKSQT